jgi:hypothetical protein
MDFNSLKHLSPQTQRAASSERFISAGTMGRFDPSMAKFVIGEMVDNAADDHEGGTVIAVFPKVDSN